MIGFWKSIRFLVTDHCNFRCRFCHNEGQKKSYVSGHMGFSGFKSVSDALTEKWMFSDIVFSGGEPFENESIVSMLKYAIDKDVGDVSCASNFSLTTESQIQALSGCRIKFNIQFPYADPVRYQASTGQPYFEKVVTKIDLARKSGIEVGVNTVVRTFDPSQIDGVLDFAVGHGVAVKFLPDVGNSSCNNLLSLVNRYLASRIVHRVDKGTGAIKWHVLADNGVVNVLYVNPPCFNKDILTCKQFGELRVTPRLGIQTCLFGDVVCSVADISNSEIQKRCLAAWKSFRNCS